MQLAKEESTSETISEVLFNRIIVKCNKLVEYFMDDNKK